MREEERVNSVVTLEREDREASLMRQQGQRCAGREGA